MERAGLARALFARPWPLLLKPPEKESEEAWLRLGRRSPCERLFGRPRRSFPRCPLSLPASPPLSTVDAASGANAAVPAGAKAAAGAAAGATVTAGAPERGSRVAAWLPGSEPLPRPGPGGRRGRWFRGYFRYFRCRAPLRCRGGRQPAGSLPREAYLSPGRQCRGRILQNGRGRRLVLGQRGLGRRRKPDSADGNTARRPLITGRMDNFSASLQLADALAKPPNNKQPEGLADKFAADQHQLVGCGPQNSHLPPSPPCPRPS